MKIQFLFFGEGSSDTALVPILEELCLAMGAQEALGNRTDTVLQITKSR